MTTLTLAWKSGGGSASVGVDHSGIYRLGWKEF